MLDIKCPSCQRQLQLPEEQTARACECPACHAVFAPCDGEILRPGYVDTEFDPVDLFIEKQARDLEVIAERERYRRELDDEANEDIVASLGWQQAKLAARIGFFLGFGGCLLFACSTPRLLDKMGYCALFGWALLSGVLCAICASILVGTSRRYGRTRVISGALISWGVVVAFASYNAWSGPGRLQLPVVLFVVAMAGVIGIIVSFIIASFVYAAWKTIRGIFRGKLSDD